MKPIPFLLLFFACLGAGAQEIEGLYTANFLGLESIRFVGRDSFHFNGFYCASGVRGKGRCEIREDRLYLYFENKPIVDSAKVPAPVIHKSASIDGRSLIEVVCTDTAGLPLPFITVLAKPSWYNGVGTTADAEGHATLRIGGEAFPLTLAIEGNEIDPLTIRLDSSADYAIRLSLRVLPANKVLNRGEVYVYEIGDLTEELILMRPQGSKERWRRYRKSR